MGSTSLIVAAVGRCCLILALHLLLRLDITADSPLLCTNCSVALTGQETVQMQPSTLPVYPCAWKQHSLPSLRLLCSGALSLPAAPERQLAASPAVGPLSSE